MDSSRTNHSQYSKNSSDLGNNDREKSPPRSRDRQDSDFDLDFELEKIDSEALERRRNGTLCANWSEVDFDGMLADLDEDDPRTDEPASALNEVPAHRNCGSSNGPSNDVTAANLELSNEVIEPTAKPASNKVTKNKRRRDSKDRKAIKKIRNYRPVVAPNLSPAFIPS